MKFQLSELPADKFENASASELLTWALNRFGSNLALASSFGPEDMVLIDMASQIDPAVRVFSLDTGRLHQDTYDLMDRVRNRYGIRLEVLFPNATKVEEMVSLHGINLFYDSVEKRRLCCGVRKVGPLNRILTTLDAWVTGLRRDQIVTRAHTPRVEIDHSHGGCVKISPLAGWSSQDVWDYLTENKVPYNALHDKGFPSIGCEPCTRPVKDDENPRSGRWWWENPETKECGLHLKS